MKKKKRGDVFMVCGECEECMVDLKVELLNERIFELEHAMQKMAEQIEQLYYDVHFDINE